MFDSKRQVHYMLRRGLVLSRAQEIIDETIEFCKEYLIGEIIWKCDAEAFNHGLTPLPIVHKYVDVLSQARLKLQACGINHSINPWVTVNWSDRGCR
ncbi:MAG: hypothetical protein GWP14_09480 [Actinobacteria bacterium]|nr:hypothetical protein [Actinomycetota bacterium]